MKDLLEKPYTLNEISNYNHLIISSLIFFKQTLFTRFGIPSFKENQKEALTKAMKELDMNTSYIFTYHNTETIKSGEKGIKIIPFWKVAINESL